MEFELTPTSTKLSFIVKQFGGLVTQRGRFTQITGRVELPADVSESRIEVRIPVAGIDTGNGMRDKHLRSNDFFAAETFAEIEFTSTAVVPTDSGFRLEGDLKIRDQTHTVSLDVAREGNRFRAASSLDRRDFGVKKMPNFIVSHLVEFELEVNAPS